MVFRVKEVLIAILPDMSLSMIISPELFSLFTQRVGMNNKWTWIRSSTLLLEVISKKERMLALAGPWIGHAIKCLMFFFLFCH